MKKQIVNPIMPLDEYIPDCEPHVFGDRIYVFGSHDSEKGTRYCAEENYVGWSAPVDDLTVWRYEGIIYEAVQDPNYSNENRDLYAPDVVQGNDGRYYLYYSFAGYNTPLQVAVCDTPVGKYEYYGSLRYPDGRPFNVWTMGDPAVINDDGTIRLYGGWSISSVAAEAHGGAEAAAKMPDFSKMSKEEIREYLLPAEKMLFHRTEEELRSLPEDIMGANTCVLENDMITVKGMPSRIVPGQFMSYGTGFQGHAFYEASSIRKMNDTYYFIYSSENSNELCYATSKYPDRDFEYRGVIISNGEVGYQGRKKEDRLNMTANNHGSIEKIGEQWYVFYHRQTHNSAFSRQTCAEKIEILSDGSIPQVECTSCGLNDGPLLTDRRYPAAIACNITNGHMPHITNRLGDADIPHITSRNEERFITNIKPGDRIVFKYFEFVKAVKLTLTVRGAAADIRVCVGEEESRISSADSSEWSAYSTTIHAEGTQALTISVASGGACELLDIQFAGNCLT